MPVRWIHSAATGLAMRHDVRGRRYRGGNWGVSSRHDGKGRGMSFSTPGEVAGDVRFGLLGPLLVTDAAGRAMQVPAAKQRGILAALLVTVDATVSADWLAEILWAASPPPNAAIAVRNYVMRLRRQISAAGARIVTRPQGYAVELH